MSNNEAFSIPIRIYYEDTDAGGIVYHTNYLKFMERSRTEWLRNLGIEQQSLMEQSIGFVVKDLTMKNSKAALFNDMLSIRDSANTHNNKNVLSSDKELLVSAEVRVACVDLGKMKPIAIPDFILREIKRAV